MQALQGMDPDKMIVIFPAALAVMYIVVSVQNYLCQRRNEYIGLILPVLSFIAASVIAFTSLVTIDNAFQQEGLVVYCLRMWLTYNILTLVFLFPYYKHRKLRSASSQSNQSAESAKKPRCRR